LGVLGAIILLVCGGVTIAVGLSVRNVVRAMSSNPHAPTSSKRDDPTPVAMGREEFDAAVLGKTKAQVRAAVGKPDSSSEAESSEVFRWIYLKRTFDKANGRIDPSRSVHFKSGVATATD